MYSAVMAILNHVVDNWTEFDAWALNQGFDPLEVPSRRLVAAAWAFLTKDMEPDVKEKLIYDLTMEESLQEVTRSSPPVPARPVEGSKVTTSGSKWQMPEGWTPPGWDEEKSYQAATSFMSFNANPK